MNTCYTTIRGYMTKAFALMFLVPGLSINIANAQDAKTTKQSSNPKNRIAMPSQDANWQKGGIFEGFTPDQEIREKRSKNAKHFRNSNGTITAQIGRTLHYQAADGSWQDIDLSVKQGTSRAGYQFQNTTNEVKSYFPANPGQNGVVMGLGNGVEFNWWKTPSLKFTNNGQVLKTFAPATISGTSQNDKLLYANVYNGISEEFVVLAEGLENNTIIHSLTPEMSALTGNAMLEFTQFIPLSNGWQVFSDGQVRTSDFEAKDFAIHIPGMENKVNFGRIIVFDNNISRDDAMLINAPAEKLSAEQKAQLNNSVYTIAYKVRFVNGGMEITSSLPASWLKSSSRAFPVVIDPTVTISPTGLQSTFYGPLSHWYGYQRHADLYLQSEVGAYGLITQIEYNSTTAGTAGSRPTKVYMRTTTATTLTGTDAWNSPTYTGTGATVCLDANTDQGNTTGWKSLALTTPFIYDEGNLLVMVNDSWGGSGSVKYYNISTSAPGRQAGKRVDVTDPGDATSTTVENYLPEIRITYSGLSDCAGVPELGDATSTVTSVCLGASFNLNIADVPSENGITFQWQSSTDGTVWTNIGTAQATSAYTVTGQTEATSYRVIVTCTISSDSDTSGVVAVTMGAPTDCYCTPATSNCGLDDEILNVTFAGINNNSSCTTGGYQNYSGSVAPAAITTGLSYPISVTTGDGGNEAVAVWIDYNQNGLFETSEYTYIGNTPGGTVTGSVVIPGTALAGTTRMRVRSFYVVSPADPQNTYPSAANPTCGTISTGFGETEDYAVTITPGADCAGTPDAGNATASVTTVCVGAPIVLNSSAANTEIGVDFQWQSSTDGGATWTNLGAVQSFPMYTVSSQTQATQYRLIATCTNSGDSDTSAVVAVAQSAAATCYCINNIPLNCTDGDVITNVTFESINNNSGCGNTTSGYSDYTTSVAPAQIVAGTTVPVSVTVGPSGDGWMYESVGIWIDYNQNGIMDSVENEYTNLGTGLNEVLSGNVIIPSTALAGPTRMRVVVSASINMLNAYVCGPLSPTTNYGEMEDYTVNIINNTAPEVDSVVVTTQGNVPAVIATTTGSLQLEAAVYPATVNQSVTWSIIPVTGTATISASGLVGAQTAGTVWGKAVSVEDPTKADSILITINAVTVTVDSVVVTTVGGVPATITTLSGTLPLQATVYPTSLAQTVTWSIVPGTGTAIISTGGVVSAQTNGTVWGKATSTLDASKSDSVLITITGQNIGLEEYLTSFNFSLYPNPTEDMVVLKSTSGHVALELQLMDLSGKVLSTRMVQSNELNAGISVDMSIFSSGMYILKLEGEGVRIHKQVIRK